MLNSKCVCVFCCQLFFILSFFIPFVILCLTLIHQQLKYKIQFPIHSFKNRFYIYLSVCILYIRIRIRKAFLHSLFFFHLSFLWWNLLCSIFSLSSAPFHGGVRCTFSFFVVHFGFVVAIFLAFHICYIFSWIRFFRFFW